MLCPSDLVAACSGGKFDLVVIRVNGDAAMVFSMGGGSARMVSSRMRREEKLFARGSSEVRMSNEVASSISVCSTPCMRGE